MSTTIVPIITEVTTTDATPTRLPPFATVSGDVVRSSVRMTALSDDNHAATWDIDALFVNVAGELTVIGFIKGGGISDSISKSWDVTLQIRPEDHTNLEFVVTGANGLTIRWATNGVFDVLSVGA